MVRNLDDAIDGFGSRVDGFFDRLFGVGQPREPTIYTDTTANNPAAENGAVAAAPIASEYTAAPGAAGYAVAPGTHLPHWDSTSHYHPKMMSKKQEKDYALYLDDFEGTTKYLLNALYDPQSRPKVGSGTITDEDLAAVAMHLRDVRNLTRTKSEVIDGPEDVVLMEEGNIAIYFDGKNVMRDGSEIMIFPVDVETLKPIYGLTTTAKVKMYKAGSEVDLSRVKMSSKLAQKFFGEKYLSTELKPGLKRDLPVHIELLKGEPYSAQTLSANMPKELLPMAQKQLKELKDGVLEMALKDMKGMKAVAVPKYEFNPEMYLPALYTSQQLAPGVLDENLMKSMIGLAELYSGIGQSAAVALPAPKKQPAKRRAPAKKKTSHRIIKPGAPVGLRAHIDSVYYEERTLTTFEQSL